jgi:hypothetical protein
MVLDFSKLQTKIATSPLIEPRKIFTTLPRNPRFKRPSDEQAEVLDEWFAKRTRSDTTIKMNTGAGKTAVGLLVLQSSANENIGPCVYVTPDNYLAEQVVAEAHDLGVKVAVKEDDPAFLSGKAILVINVWKLFNGRSVFGVGNQGSKIPIGAIVIDDAHACLTTVAEQFSSRLDATHPIYRDLFEMFREDLQRQSVTGLLDIEASEPRALVEVPYWAWKDRNTSVAKLIHEHRADDEVKFTWPLVRDVLPLC